MRSKLFFYALIVIALSLPAASVMASPIMNYTVQVPPGRTPEQVKAAIEESMRMRGWLGEETSANAIVATFIKRDRAFQPKHTLLVEVSYDQQVVRVDYLDSDNLKYKREAGGPDLHRAAVSWIENLANDISGFLWQGQRAPPTEARPAL